MDVHKANSFCGLREVLKAYGIVALGVFILMSASGLAARAQAPTASDDPFIWLEDVNGARAMSWVRAENARTLGVLEADPRYAGLHAQALALFEAKDRIPRPEFIGGEVYNFWQDGDHVRGLWRRTSVASYDASETGWATVLDLDAVAKAEGANWVWKGADCERPAEQRCLVGLSDGGEDAVTIREFDLATARFVDGGFTLPRGKQTAAWEDETSLLVAREWEPGQLTKSGYPYVVKRLKRGQALSQAVEVFRGSPSDMMVDPTTFVDGQGRKLTVLTRAVSFFEAERYIVEAGGVRRLGLPAKAELLTLVDGRLVLSLAQDWSVDGVRFPSGALVSLDLKALAADPEHPKPVLIRAPGPRESIEVADGTRSELIVVAYENVRGRAFVYSPAPEGGWTSRRLELPDNASVGISAADNRSDRAYLSVASFLLPSSLWSPDAASGTPAKVKSLPAKFDASKDEVEQLEATSSDGTKIPYFVVHPKGMKLDGSNPTILHAYGGFQVSQTPSYSAELGKLWLERGGVYVLANIRGGGEFGPAWHEAGLKTHRQRIYDDFAAVAKDLVARGITSPRRLGISGGSNGGLLMGVEMTQHPELFRAVDIAVPLLDMLRFEQIAAGASWVGEYGSVSNPDERAFLASISPYQNLKSGVDYPEPLIWSTTKDDRVGPQHARKFAAKLKDMSRPYLYYEVIEGGHGAGANLEEEARTTALEMTYFTRKLMD